jgi:pre-mRNA-splicing factor CDC5/CEF1
LQAEQLINQEILLLIHHDALFNPTVDQQPPSSTGTQAVIDEDKHVAYLKAHAYQQFGDEELRQVSL